MSSATQTADGGVETATRGRSGTRTGSHDPRAAQARLPLDGPLCPQRPIVWSPAVAGVTTVALVLVLLPGRAAIPPLIESDYCYQLVAADRMFDGLGLTATSPVAPFQPWDWQRDWTFLTRWPIGYPLIIWAARSLFDLTTVRACQWISVAACAAALVGWFVWIGRNVPAGVTRLALAGAAAGCSVSVAALTDPSTDALLMAALPWILLLTHRAVDLATHEWREGGQRRVAWLLALAGLLSGSLFWIRYAAAFVPLAVGVYLFVERRLRRGVSLRNVALFAVAAAIPITTMFMVNRAWSVNTSTQAQLNLGSTITFDFSLAQLGRVWWRFTDLGYYDYYRLAHWALALWPAMLAVAAISSRRVRTLLGSFLATPGACLSAVTVVALLMMLICATALFGDKFDYVGLDRYYRPIKPLYFLLFVAPLMLIPRRAVRAVLCVVLLAACSWTVKQEWSRTYTRWLAADRSVSPYGRWSRCFEPGAAELYRWLAGQNEPGLIVVSNFHEYITLETGIPALPIPPDATTLDRWVDRIHVTRNVIDSRILFVLDPDNRWRSYWIPEPADIIRDFRLAPRRDLSEAFDKYVYDYDSGHIVDGLPYRREGAVCGKFSLSTRVRTEEGFSIQRR